MKLRLDAFTLCSVLRALLSRARSNGALLTTLVRNTETIMSDIAREAQESRESNAEVKKVVGEVVQRLLDERATDKAALAAKDAEIATLKGEVADTAAAATDLDAQQAENKVFVETLKTVGIDVVVPAPEPEA